MEEMKIVYRSLVGKHEGNRPIGRPKRIILQFIWRWRCVD
jgi:hypothetical protein